MSDNPIRILLIEDNPGDARLIREMLNEAQSVPFILEWRDSLSAAMQKLNEDGADAILTDLGLSDSQGLDTYQKLHMQFPETPIVVLSSLHDESVAVKAVRDGAQDYLVKGQIDAKLLIRAVRYAIERRQVEVALRQAYHELEDEVARRKKVEEELIMNQEQLRNLYLNLQSMREEERSSIAREIHDELGQSLAAIKFDIAWIKGKYFDHERIIEKTSSTLSLIDSTITSVKKICTELRPGILDHLGLGPAIQWQAGEFQNRTGIQCEVFLQEDIQLDRDCTTALFRIFQEALTNILRHADATKITASLTENDGTVILEVVDNGKGISEEAIAKPNSFGLLGMRERVYPWSGIVTINGCPNKGTRIEVILQLYSS